MKQGFNNCLLQDYLQLHPDEGAADLAVRKAKAVKSHQGSAGQDQLAQSCPNIGAPLHEEGCHAKLRKEALLTTSIVITTTSSHQHKHHQLVAVVTAVAVAVSTARGRAVLC